MDPKTPSPVRKEIQTTLVPLIANLDLCEVSLEAALLQLTLPDNVVGARLVLISSNPLSRIARSLALDEKISKVEVDHAYQSYEWALVQEFWDGEKFLRLGIHTLGA